MNATALSNLPRAELISLAKAHKIKANLATKVIISQLVQRFPDGVPPATPKAPQSTPPKTLVGRVKDVFNSITRGSNTPSPPPVARAKSASPSSREPAAAVSDNLGGAKPNSEHPPTTADAPPVPSAAHEDVAESGEYSGTAAAVPSLPPPPPSTVQPPVEPVNELTEAQIADLAPAESEAIQTLIQDMAIISAKNKAYLAQAATMREQTRAIAKETRTLTTAFKVEQFRRQRLENYLKHWRPIDPRWSYSAAWAGPITVAPVLVRYEGLKGYIVKEREVSTSDDELLVTEWHQQDEAFRARRKVLTKKKGEQRGVDVGMVSEEELHSDEEDFYSPYVLRPKKDDGKTPDSDCHVYPVFFGTGSVLLDRKEEIIVPSYSNRSNVRASGSRNKRTLDDDAQSDDEARYSRRARSDSESDDGMQWEYDTADAMGETVGDDWEGVGGYVEGWRMESDSDVNSW